MGKRNKTDPKSSKRRTRTSKRNKSTPSAKTQRSQAASKNSETIKNANNLFIEPTLSDLINSLDLPLLFISDSEFKIPFPLNINIREFEKYFKKGIYYARNHFNAKNLKLLKIFLLVLKKNGGENDDDVFGLKSCVNKLQRTFKIDLIFSLLSKEKMIEAFEIEDIALAENIFKAGPDYLLLINNKIFQNAMIYNKNINGIYSFTNFENLLYSPTILNTYKEVLKELYEINISEKEIKRYFKDFIKIHDIYFISVRKDIFGMILYDGTILINKMYYEFNDIVNAFTIYFTLFHELTHAISRLVRGDNNYLLNTDEFTKNKKIKVEESGEYFEKRFLLDILKEKKITLYEAKYLMDQNNYKYNTIEEFKNNYINFRNKNMNLIKSQPASHICKRSNNDTYSLEINCYCAGYRTNYN